MPCHCSTITEAKSFILGIVLVLILNSIVTACRLPAHARKRDSKESYAHCGGRALDRVILAAASGIGKNPACNLDSRSHWSRSRLLGI